MMRTVAGCVMLGFGCWALAEGPPVIIVPKTAQPPAELPPAVRVKADPAPKATPDPDAAVDAERKELRKRLDELLKRLEVKAKAPAPEPKKVVPKVEPIPEPKLELPTVPPKVVEPKAIDIGGDPLAAGQRLYKAGDVDGALTAFQLVDPATAGGNKPFVRYMTACCLRRAGKLSEAAEIYREVAAADDDAFMAECAQWQLGSIKWREDAEVQLEKLRGRREAAK